MSFYWWGIAFYPGKSGIQRKKSVDDYHKRAKSSCHCIWWESDTQNGPVMGKQMIDRYRNKSNRAKGIILRWQSSYACRRIMRTLAWIDAFTKKQDYKQNPTSWLWNKNIRFAGSVRPGNKKAAARRVDCRVIANYDWDYKKGKKPEDTSKNTASRCVDWKSEMA